MVLNEQNEHTLTFIAVLWKLKLFLKNQYETCVLSEVDIKWMEEMSLSWNKIPLGLIFLQNLVKGLYNISSILIAVSRLWHKVSLS